MLESLVITVLFVHLMEEQNDAVITLSHINIHGKVLSYIDVMVGILLISCVAIHPKEVLKGL